MVWGGALVIRIQGCLRYLNFRVRIPKINLAQQQVVCDIQVLKQLLIISMRCQIRASTLYRHFVRYYDVLVS